MTGLRRNGKAVLVIASVLACTAVAVSVSLVYPTRVANPELGAEWQCHRTVGIVTTCHRISHVEPTSRYWLTHPVGSFQA
jgi:hypothetical protein